MRNLLKIAVWLSLILLFAQCSKKESFPVPEKLGGLPLHQKVEGEKAREIIARLHVGNFQQGESMVAFYKNNNQVATLYISRFKNQSLADSMLQRMASKVGQEGTGFWHHLVLPLGEYTIHLTMGQGQAHYFFTQKNAVYWLASPMEKGSTMLSQILNIPEQEIKKAIYNAIHGGMMNENQKK